MENPFDLVWDKCEIFPHPQTGVPLIEWAVSTVGTTRIEVSMCDERIWKEVPREEWMGVLVAPSNNMKMNCIVGGWVILFGFGKPADPAGNIMLVRVTSDIAFLIANPKSPDAEHYTRAISLILLTAQRLGLDPRHDAVTGNN